MRMSSMARMALVLAAVGMGGMQERPDRVVNTVPQPIQDEKIARAAQRRERRQERNVELFVCREPSPKIRLHIEPRKPHHWSKKAKRGRP